MIDTDKVNDVVRKIRALRILNHKSGVYTKKFQTQALTGLSDDEVLAVAEILAGLNEAQNV